jgi:NAD(P)-dependent dehydrogenase (short-subunit alcohol dehydrogenase family)
VALVTGAARRIGRAITLHLAAHGWDVVLHHRSSAAGAEATAADARALGARAWLVAADLADDTACNALVPAAVAQAGRLDAVVNNASLFELRRCGQLQMHRADGRAALARQHRAGGAAGPRPARPPGRTRRPGLRGQPARPEAGNPNPDYFSYTLSKAALAAATVMLAQALAPRAAGVRRGAGRDAGLRPHERGRIRRRAPLTPLQRSSTPDDIAGACAFCWNRRRSPAPRCWSTAASTCWPAARRAVPGLSNNSSNNGLRPPPRIDAKPAHHPSLMDCRRLFLRDYEVWINIGVHDFEKKGEQRVKINVDLYVPLALSTPQADKLDEVLDYDFIRRTITERVSAATSTCRRPWPTTCSS